MPTTRGRFLGPGETSAQEQQAWEVVQPRRDATGEKYDEEFQDAKYKTQLCANYMRAGRCDL